MSETTPQLTGLKSKEQPAAFRAWVAQQDWADTNTWLASLDEKGLTNITSEMAAFCEDAGFDLAWLIQNQINKEALRETLENAVRLNLQAFHHASRVQPSLTLYKTLVDWLQKPTSRKYRHDTRAIYSQLAQEGVIPPASADALLDTNKNRWQHVTDALHTAYRNDPNAVERAVQTIILTEDASATTQSERNWWPFARQPEPAAT